MADITQEQPAESRTDIQIDTSILTQQEKTTTSLCDKYDVHVFGADIEALEHEQEKEEELEQEKILTDVFTRQPKADREEVLRTVMAAETSAVVRKEYETEEEAGGISMYAYLLTITITNRKSRKSYDIQADSGQRIGTTLRVLKENLPGFIWTEGSLIQSERTRRRIQPEQTYEEAGIYTGDRLWMIEKY